MRSANDTSKACSLLALALLLAGCGGGGASGSSAPAPAPPPAPVSNQSPSASFVATPSAGTVPLTVSFDASASSDSDGTIVRFAWNFGDGSSDAGSSVQHTYQTPGAFTATLQAFDDDGAVGNASIDIDASGFTLSGTINIQAASAIDSDVNDSFSTPVSNNDFITAQLIANPATVGGYVAALGAGPAGALSATGDEVDYFRFEALGGETIVLSIGEDGEDLDLRLFADPSAPPVDDSLDIVSPEIVRVPPNAPGTYFIQVSTFMSAASTYVLNIGQFEAAAFPETLSSNSEFVSDELILGPAVAARATAQAGASASITRGARGVDGRERLLRIDQSYETRLLASRQTAGATGIRSGDAAADAHLRTLSALKEVHARGEHQWVEPNWIRRPLLTPNDQFFPSQWHYDAIRLPQAWDLTQGDPSVVVAVIDSGILLDHPEFQGQLVDGYDLVEDPVNAGDGDGRDSDPTDPGGGFDVSSFHGSHVAGTVAARTDNAPAGDTGGGVAGVGWNTRVMPLRALGVDGGTAFDVRQALRFAGGLPNASGTTANPPADIVNLSLGGGGFSQADQDVIDEMRAAGIIVIAAAGNEASSTPSFPAAYDGVVSVSATTINNRQARYSNFGSTIDIAAPGGDSSTDINGDGIGDGVLSVVGDDSDDDPSTPPEPRLGVLSGTSMAAPHVAGVVALMKSVHPGLTPEQFDAMLASGAITEDLGAAGRDDVFGHGLIDAQQAVVAALEFATGGGGVPGILVSAPGRLNFGGFAENLEVRLSNAGNQALSVTGSSASAPWLGLTPIDVDAQGLGDYRVTVERDLLPSDGLFNGSVSITSTANTAVISVIVQRAANDLFANAGTTFVILTAPGGGENLVPFVAVEAEQGAYTFELADVPPGDYELAAGSDSDNDNTLCEGGESCGIFPTTDAPTTLRIDADRSGLDFVTSFSTSISIQSESTDAPSSPQANYRVVKPADGSAETAADSVSDSESGTGPPPRPAQD